MITHRSTPVDLNSVPQIARALRDLEIERLQIIAALNVILAKSDAGTYQVPFVDENGTPFALRLVAGAGVTITIDTGAGTCTISSP